MRITDTSFRAELRDQLAANLGGFAVQSAPARGRAAAVAVTLVEAEGNTAFVLTRRARHLKNHPGQFALPGGRVDRGETPEQAALRELREEVGVDVESDAVLGHLDDFVTRSGFAVTPVVVWAGSVELVADPAEVHAVYEVPIRELDRDDAPRLTYIPQAEEPVLSMPLLGDFVHAPTAVFLYQFREVALRGRATRVAHYEQPLFAWR